MAMRSSDVAATIAQDEQPRSVFKEGVDLVKVPVFVTDRDRRFVSGLSQDEFVVSDEGRSQTIVSFSRERASVSVGVLVDSSSSISARRVEAARMALHGLFDRLESDDELFVAEFSERPRLLQAWTSDRAELRRALNRLSAGQVGAAPHTAMYEAVNLMLQIAGHGQRVKKALLVISDGDDNFSTVREEDVRRAIRGSDVLVYALGLAEATPGGRVNERALRRLTDESGGRTEVVTSLEQVREAITRLAVELGEQYLLGYAPPPGPPNRWHDIKVELPRQKNVTVRARPGYISK